MNQIPEQPTPECPQCGEVVQRVRETTALAESTRAVFRCRNGHTVIVQIVQEYADDAPGG